MRHRARPAEDQHRQNHRRHHQSVQHQPGLGIGQSRQGQQHTDQRPCRRRDRHQAAQRPLLSIRHAIARPGHQRAQHHVERNLPCGNRHQEQAHALDAEQTRQQQAREDRPGKNPRLARPGDIAQPSECDVRKARRDRADEGGIGQDHDRLIAPHDRCAQWQEQGQERRVGGRSARHGQSIQQQIAARLHRRGDGFCLAILHGRQV